MKTKTVEILVFEPGDVLDLSAVVFRLSDGRENNLTHSMKRKATQNASRMLVISAEQVKAGMLYRGFMSNGKAMSLKQSEVDGAVCVGHIELGGFIDE